MKRNSYNFSNDLARIGGALSKAMLGDASDDAAIALAQYRDAQTASTEQDTTQTGLVNTARNSAVGDPRLQGVVANALGLNTISPEFIGAPSSNQMRLGTPFANNLTQAFLGSGGTAQQMANAAKVFGDAGFSRLAENMILQGSPDEMRRGAIGKGLNPGKYFDVGAADTEIGNTLTAALDKNQTTLEGKKDETEAKFGEDGQFDRNNIRDNKTTKALGLDLTDAKERWNNFKANKELEASQYGDDVQAGVDRDKNKAADETVRYKHDNRTVEFTVEPGKLLVIDPVSAQKAKIPIQKEGKYKGLYILDGGQNLKDGVKVTVGQADVIVTKEVAELLGIPKVNGQYRVKGAGYNSGSSTSGSSGSVGFAVSPSDDTALRDFIDAQDTENVIDEMPNAATIVNQLVIQSVKGMGAKKNIPNAKAYITQKLSRGFTEFPVPNTGIAGQFVDTFNVPNFLIDEFNGTTGNVQNDKAIKALRQQSPDTWLKAATGILDQHGFSADQIAIILGQ